MLEASWKDRLADEFEKTYMKNLRVFLREEKAAKKYIYPKGSEIFKAFECTPFEEVKVVILGQDPYHGPMQAHGLSFSVPEGVRVPPSLINIYKELESDLGVKRPSHGCLESWAKQGVLLLNSVLTVERGAAASHQGKGWEIFTDRVVNILNADPRPKVFVLWGAYAQRKGEIINRERHLVLASVHPSPLSANRGFFGSRPFSQINAFLEQTDQTKINWSI